RALSIYRPGLGGSASRFERHPQIAAQRWPQGFAPPRLLLHWCQTRDWGFLLPQMHVRHFRRQQGPRMKIEMDRPPRMPPKLLPFSKRFDLNSMAEAHFPPVWGRESPPPATPEGARQHCQSLKPAPDDRYLQQAGAAPPSQSSAQNHGRRAPHHLHLAIVPSQKIRGARYARSLRRASCAPILEVLRSSRPNQNQRYREKNHSERRQRNA